MAFYDLDFRPENLIPNVVYREFGAEPSAEEEEKLKGACRNFDSVNVQTLCRACGWNTHHEIATSYLPRLHVEHTRSNQGLWSMGNDWLVWDRTREECGNDYMTHQFLQKQGTKHIPLVKEMVEFKDEDGRYNFVVMSRARGVTLESVWKGLSREKKDNYAQQIIVALRELRQFTAEFPQRVDGSPLWDNIIGNCNSRKKCKKVGKTKEDWINNMDEELREGISRKLQTRDKTVIDARLQELKMEHRMSLPMLISTWATSLFDDGKIVAIIDWELAGYYPWWVEVYTSYNRGLSHNATELFDIVWRGLDLTIDDVVKNVTPVMHAWNSCPVRHTGNTHYWLRLPFCKCQPFGGLIQKDLIDSEEKHFIGYDSKNQYGQARV